MSCIHKCEINVRVIIRVSHTSCGAYHHLEDPNLGIIIWRGLYPSGDTLDLSGLIALT